MNFDYSLYFVANPGFTRGRPLESVTEDALLGGATMVQLRCKPENGTLEEFLQYAKRLKALCAGYNVPLIINDRLDIATAVNADGVHIGQSDMEYSEARRIMGANVIIGVSATNLQEAKKAEADGADYIGVGAVFPTGSKDDACAPIGVSGLANICAGVKIPVVAIGGITIDNAKMCMMAGASGIAVISAISYADNVEKASRYLLSRIKE